jgi:hypothetical protein
MNWAEKARKFESFAPDVENCGLKLAYISRKEIRMTRKVMFLMVMAFYLLMGVGCCPLTRLNISIALDKSFQDRYGSNRTVTVDLVCVQEAEDARWQQYSMTSYWEASDTMRNAPSRKTLTFNSSKLDPQVITTSDPIWGDWMKNAADKHPPKIYVMVQIPKMFDRAKDDRPGSEDPRRQLLETKSCSYSKLPPTVQLVLDADRLSRR